MDVVILAAGMGTRMKSTLPKVLHRIFDKPIIDYVIECAQSLKPASILVVVNPSLTEVIQHLNSKAIKIVFQNEPKGTANALYSALPYIKNEKILILNGDTPLIKKDTLLNFLKIFDEKAQDLAILSFYPGREHSYGRILRNSKGDVEKIVEITDYTGSESGEANSGVYLVKKEVLELVKEIKINPRKGEFYLTDIVEIAISKGYKVDAYALAQEDELIGINNREELALAMKYLRDRVVKEWMNEGVTFYDPGSVWISPSVKIGQDTIIYPDVFLEGDTTIGRNCVIYQGTRIRDSIIEDNVLIKDCTVIESSHVKAGSKIGPFAHLRPESVIGKECRIGNFVEVKKSVIGDRTKAAHLSYLGDSEIGENVNIGAGTITCNYDGKRKHKTIIEDNVFIGSDTQLVAPVKVGKGAYIGAGSTITKNVPEDSLAISRTPQRNIEGWAKKKREKK
ncbi:MAG: UDP-N-acetylglucosamine diphosphorylase/glucosamine-1-phosphate N-acetyltransferase [Thermodesulfovibrio aggregans]|uniref:Bifunctional protein GlmU n=1 Tax=Thermodesulfovibrio aggregans TaxID=86166 RepID=A0A2J6WQM2_9BACT|nr:MAG: UDP-N-acetylglucosamine diphosphorylase/glucosamine-1-phosphate N-acetyltransferase [Thermodesulfovibrio aggregans]